MSSRSHETKASFFLTPHLDRSSWYESQKAMTLLDAICGLDALDAEYTLYVAEPWTSELAAHLSAEPESGRLPSEAERLGCTYFLEVFIARNSSTDGGRIWPWNPRCQSCLRLIEYAINDA